MEFSIRQSTFLKFWSWLLALVWRYGASSTFWKVTGRTTLRQKSQGIKQLMAGGGVVLIGLQLIPLLSGLFS